MRLKGSSLGFVVNFLLGVAWASVIIGAVSSFLSFYHESFFIACISAIVATIPGMIAILFLEVLITVKEKHEELKKHTALLEHLVEEKRDIS